MRLSESINANLLRTAAHRGFWLGVTFQLATVGIVLGCFWVGAVVYRSTRLPNPVKLVSDIVSYSSPDQVRALLHVPEADWQIVEDTRHDPADPRPPFEVLQVAVQGHMHYQVSGRLVLEFYNNQLASTCFYPVDPVRYQMNLEKAQRLHFRPRRLLSSVSFTELEARIPPYTEIVVGKDYAGRIYFNWHDVRLVKAMRRWIYVYD